MTKYIFITIIVIALILVLAWKQSPKEQDIEHTNENKISDITSELNKDQTDNMLKDVNNVPKENKIVYLKTSLGDIKIELFLEKMPITAGNFLKLAESNFYDGVTFHRVIPGFMIQGGDPLSKDDNPNNDGTGGPGYFIEDEFNPDFTNEPGTIAMANSGPNTGGSQFFINVANNSFLDSKHPVFGKVLEGMDVVEKIVNVKHDKRDRPIENVVINKIIVE